MGPPPDLLKIGRGEKQFTHQIFGRKKKMKRDSREARARAILGRRINLPVYRYCEFWLFGNNETRSPMRGVGMKGPRKKIPFQAPDFPWRWITRGVPPETAISTRYFGSRVPSSIDGSVRLRI